MSDGTTRPPFKLLKTFTLVEGSSDIFLMDTIDYGGHLWLVPEWREALEAGFRRPRRIILMDFLEYHALPADQPADYMLTDELPKDVLAGRVPSGQEARYHIEEEPDLVHFLGPSSGTRQ